jgi:hypothetical protein
MPTRIAILVSCPGYGKEHLFGANKDIENMFNYLISPRGGAWKKQEIILLYNPTWSDVKMNIDKLLTDYQFIYFAGHGSGGECRKRYLGFKDGVVEDINLLNAIPKQLIIIDACRVFYPTISGIPPAEDAYSNFTGESNARIAFDHCITNSRNGKVIVHATKHGYEAEEERYRRGGAFTLALLYTSLQFKTGVNLCPVNISDLLPTVHKTLINQNYWQEPEVAYEEGELSVPFLIDVEQVIIEEIDEERTYKPPIKKITFLQGIAISVFVIVVLRGLKN